MNDELIDIRRPLAVSPNARVEIGQDGTIHVLAGPITLHVERGFCEELTTTLARAMVRLVHERQGAQTWKRPPDSPHLRVIATKHEPRSTDSLLFEHDDRAATSIDASYQNRMAPSPSGSESESSDLRRESP